MRAAPSTLPADERSAVCSQGQIDIRAGYLRYLDSDKATLDGLNMQLPIGQWTCILGRSGCGKTSLLRYLAGLLDNLVEWDGRLTIKRALNTGVNGADSMSHHIAYMAQQDLLMPWLSALDNVLLSTRFGVSAKQNKNQMAEQKDKALTLLEKVGLVDKAHYSPMQLSGGMRQRVALARTLMQDQPIVLMDEPFSALDAVTRHRLQRLAFELLADKTVVLITHDPQEAIRLGHKLYVMQGSPAHAQAIELPAALSSSDVGMPRKYDAQSALLQQVIIERLEQDYV